MAAANNYAAGSWLGSVEGKMNWCALLQDMLHENGFPHRALVIGKALVMINHVCSLG